MRGLLIARCHTAKLLELAEAAFDKVALGIEVSVERVLESTRGIVGNDRLGSFGADGLADVVGIVGGIGDDDVGRCAVEKCPGLRSVALVAGGENEADWAAQPADGKMNFSGQAAARASDGLIVSPPFAPLAC